jgi:hypothetical protein
LRLFSLGDQPVLVRRTRGAVAAALLALLAVVTAAAPATAAPAVIGDPWEVDAIGYCRALERGTTVPLDVVAVNGTGRTQHELSLAAVTMPPGVTVAAFTPATTLLRSGEVTFFRTSVTIAQDAPLGDVTLTFALATPDGPVQVQHLARVTGAPAAPTGITAVPGDATAEVSWTPATPNGLAGEPVAHYTVTASPGGATAEVVLPGDDPDPATLTATVGALANGTAHTFTVAAWTPYGTATSAPSAPVVPVAPPAVEDEPGVPAQVGTVTATPGDESVALSWPAVPDAIAYEVVTQPGGAVETVWNGTTHTVTSLTDGTTYAFAVRAVSGTGTGPASDPVTATPSGTPAAVRVAVAARDGEAVACFEPPYGRGRPVTSIVVEDGQGRSWTFPGDARTGILDGLTNGAAYALTAHAVNAHGAGASSGAYHGGFSPSGPPLAPASVAATPADGAAVVDWAPAPANGASVAAYEVAASPGGHSLVLPGGVTDAELDGLANGTAYTISVRAVNSNGPGPWATAPAAVVPAGPPLAPAGVTATPGDGEATVSWQPAGTNGPDPVTGYHVVADPGGATVDAAAGAASAVVGGLVNGTAYTFTVVAANAHGDGPASEPSGAVTPAGVPFAPPAVYALPRADDPAAIDVWWAAADANGSPVTSHTVTVSPGGATIVVPDSATETLVTGLTPGTAYTFTVTATNALGTSAASAASDPVTANGLPLKVTGVKGSMHPTDPAAVVIAWDAADGNKRSVTGYVVTASPGGPVVQAAGNATSAVVSGLTYGKAYTFTVAATNSVGTGPASDPVGPTTRYDVVKPVVTILSTPPAVTSDATATVTFGGSDPYRPDAVLTFSCRLDFKTAVPCASPWTGSGLTTGDHYLLVTAKDEAGNVSETELAHWRVDRTAPAISPRYVDGFPTTPGVTFGWDGIDQTAVASYDVRYRVARYDGGFGAYRYRASAQGTTATSFPVALTRGYTYCVGVRARDTLGNVGAWNTPQCVGTPLDDRSLSASAGWTRHTSAGFYGGTYTFARTAGRTLTLRAVEGRMLGLVARTCPGCGKVRVLLDGVDVGEISTNAARTTYRKKWGVGFRYLRSGTVTLVTVDDKPVYIDGLAVLRT